MKIEILVRENCYLDNRTIFINIKPNMGLKTVRIHNLFYSKILDYNMIRNYIIKYLNIDVDSHIMINVIDIQNERYDYVSVLEKIIVVMKIDEFKSWNRKFKIKTIENNI